MHYCIYRYDPTQIRNFYSSVFDILVLFNSQMFSHRKLFIYFLSVPNNQQRVIALRLLTQRVINCFVTSHASFYSRSAMPACRSKPLRVLETPP